MPRLNSHTAYNGEVEMLSAYADLDDVNAVNDLLHTFNNLDLPEKHFWSRITKIRDIKTQYVSLNYSHTSLNF